MEDDIKRKIEEMYKNINTRSVELVFYGNRLKKIIGQRRPTPDLLREVNNELNDEKPVEEKE